MRDWQKVFLRAAGVAAGVTVALASVALSLYWYSSRPKSWDTKTISFVSTNADAFYEIDADRKEMKTAGFSLKFVLANNTDRDYTVPLGAKLFQRQARTEALEEFSGKIEHAVLIPARDRAQLTVRVDYSCRVSDLDGKHESERDEATCFHDAFGNVSGFVLLDDDNKLRITLPKPALIPEKAPKTVNGNIGESPLRR